MVNGCKTLNILGIYRGRKWPPLFSNTTCYRIYHLRNSNLLSHTEFTTCETAISYLTHNLPPYNLQCCMKHKIYHLQYNDVLSHTGFLFSLNKLAYAWEISCVFGNTPCVTTEIHLVIGKALSTQNTT